MNLNPIRRAQLIAPFGVGSLYTGPNGVATITCGLDYWYRRDDGSTTDIDVDEYAVDEWRLQRILGVGQLRTPPDYREPFAFGSSDAKNMRLGVPLLRFPLWHFCARFKCRALLRLPSTASGVQWCPRCRSGGTKSRLAQVRFIALCSNGHVQDFPWREWVHRSPTPTCNGDLRLVSTGGASLASQRIECSCGVPPRNLSGITEASNDDGHERSFITSNLTDDGEFYCRGIRPWIGDFDGEGCDRPLRGSLRSGTNVYYAHVESSIFIPRTDAKIDPTLDGLLREPPLSVWVKMARDFGQEPTASAIRESPHGALLEPFDDKDIEEGLTVVTAEAAETVTISDTDLPDDRLTQEHIRRPEHDRIRQEQKHQELTVRTLDSNQLSGKLSPLLSRVNLLDVMRETRVLYGFSRVLPTTRTYRDHRQRLWLAQPARYNQNWLPAYEVRGEGIYVELDAGQVSAWENRYRDRLEVVQRNEDRARARRSQDPQILSARYILLHTFAHLLINRLIFECGYSSASLRERLYVADGEDPMAGILIYTAAGDSEGTMGGLVRMGEIQNLEPIIRAALVAASWCSADPVCMELGQHGQGPESCNLAACHACCLLPETSCESFNKYLDRAAVVGSHSDPSLGYFSSANNPS